MYNRSCKLFVDLVKPIAMVWRKSQIPKTDTTGNKRTQAIANSTSARQGANGSMIQKAIQNSPQVQQLKALQQMANNRFRAGSFNGRPVPVQRVRLSGLQAADQAELKRATNKYDRAAMTDDHILKADEGATTNAWAAKAPHGYVFNVSPSLTHGGKGRPPCIDLKAKETGDKEAEFIFHLPVFIDTGSLINYLLDASGISQKRYNISQITTINLTTLTDHQLQKIKDTPKVDISSLLNHPIYLANSGEILAHNPNFVNDIQQQHVNPFNTQLEQIHNNPDYTTRLANMEARDAKAKYTPLFGLINTFFLNPRNATIYAHFNGILKNHMPQLEQCYAIASELFSATEKTAHTELKAKFDAYVQITVQFIQLRKALSAALATCKSTESYTLETWKLACQEYDKCGHQYTLLKPGLIKDEKDKIVKLLREFRIALNGKKPPEDLKRERDQGGDGDGNGDGSDPATKKTKTAPLVLPPPVGTQ